MSNNRYEAATTGGEANWAVWNEAGDMVTGYMFEAEAKAEAARMNSEDAR